MLRRRDGGDNSATWGDTSTMTILNRGDSDDGTLVGKTLTQLVEMCYWVVKFVGDFEKVTKGEFP